jgi:2-(1,2-epoxy-1,2-dihydrophenyl)acetyl-CoA isomerase
MSTGTGVRLEVAGGIATLTLDRPECRNAVTVAMWDLLREHFEELAADPEVEVVVLTGAGDAFCSGADTRDHGYRSYARVPRAVAQRMRMINSTAIALHQLPKPTIAAVNGVACGAGWSLALGCDIVLASAEARFATKFVDQGISLDLGATWLLARQLGAQRAKHLAFTSEFIDAAEAHRLGLVLEVHPHDELPGAVAAYAARLLDRPPEVLTQMKLAVNEALATTFAQSAEREAHAQAACAAARSQRA